MGGVASRLPDNDVKTKVNSIIAKIDETLSKVGAGAAATAAVVGQLEEGTNNLRAVIAAVPDDALGQRARAGDRNLGASAAKVGSEYPDARALA